MNGHSSSRAVGKAFGKLAFFLVVLPAAVTMLHFWMVTNLLYEDDFSFLKIAISPQNQLLPVAAGGVYRLSSSGSWDTAATYHHPVTSEQGPLRYQPDVLNMASFYNKKAPTASFEYGSKKSVGGWSLIRDGGNRWCLVDNNNSNTQNNLDGRRAVACGEKLLGEYRENGNENGSAVVATVSQLTPKSKTSSTSTVTSAVWYKIRRKLGTPVAERPATMAFIALNVILAFVYWKYHVDPRSVGKLYYAMIPTTTSSSSTTATTSSGGGEIWRTFTSATAHFEIWHLLFNMTALEGIGRELESRYFAPIEFFFYNLSLMPVTTSVWLGCQYLLRRYYYSRDTTIEDAPTVGFSGVLFAWMVVAALEQRSTCPVFFLPDLCFTTYTFEGVKVSLAPLVQLGVAQVILPRVSLTGHLAGMLCGFLIHWGMLPIGWFQPAIAVPLLYWVYLLLRKYIPVRLATGVSAATNTKQSQGALAWITRLHVMALLLSASTLGPLNSSTISLCFVSLFLYHLCQAISLNDSSRSDGYDRMPTFLRAYIVVAVIALVTQSMTLGSWVFAWSPTLVALFSWTLQCVTLLFGICKASSLLLGEECGIFKYTLYFTVVRHAKTVGESLLGGAEEASDRAKRSGATPWRPFAGSGQRLGAGARGREQEETGTGATNQELSELL